jgi:phosphoribosylanthranilate isomerase
MTIKVCGMREVQNIAAISALPIDYIGFIFYVKSPRFVEKWQDKPFVKDFLKTIKPKKVGVFVNETVEKIVEKVQTFDLQAVQLHGSETPTFIENLRQSLPPKTAIFKAFSIDENFDFQILKDFENLADKFLFDTKTPQHGGSGQKFDWQLLEKYQGDTPFLLAGGIGAADTEGVKNWQHSRLEGFDLNSRFELSPALKDVDLLREFIATIRQ